MYHEHIHKISCLCRVQKNEICNCKKILRRGFSPLRFKSIQQKSPHQITNITVFQKFKNERSVTLIIFTEMVLSCGWDASALSTGFISRLRLCERPWGIKINLGWESEVEHLFLCVGCARNKRQYPTIRRSFNRTCVGESTELGMSVCSLKTRIILIGKRARHQNGTHTLVH